MKNIKNSHTEISKKISLTYPEYNLTKNDCRSIYNNWNKKFWNAPRINVIKSSGMLLE